MRTSLAALALLALCGAARAQSCGTAYSHQRSYAPSYSYSYAAPYAAPAKVVKKVVAHDYKDVEYRLVLPVFALQVFSLPTYGAAYAPPHAPPAAPVQTPLQQQGQSQMQQILAAQAQTLEALKKLDDRLGKIEARVERIERTRQPIPLAQPQPQPKGDDAAKAFAAVNAASCAACHSRGNAEKHGGGFILSEDDGTLAALTAEQRDEVERQLTTGKMPRLNTARAREAGVKPIDQKSADAIFAALDRQKLQARKE